MKKILNNLLGIMVLVLLFSSLLPSFVLADNLQGNQQYYNVYYDEEGDAIVIAKLSFINTGEDEMDEIKINLPGHAKIINVVQEVEEKVENTRSYRGYYTQKNYYGVDYDDTTVLVDTLLTIDLEKEIGEQETATILLYYKLPESANEYLGLYDFNFQTAITDKDIHYVRVSVSAINGLAMSGVESEVDYVNNRYFDTFAMGVEVSADVAASESYESISRNVEYTQGFVKEAYGLDPYENFEVSGEYATSKFRLHLLRNIVLIGMGILFVVLISLKTRKIFSAKKINSKKQNSSEMSIVGVVTGLVISAVLVGGSYVIRNLAKWIGYQNYPEMAFLVGITMFIVTTTGLVLPGLAIGRRNRDWLMGIYCSAISIVVILISTVVAVISSMLLF